MNGSDLIQKYFTVHPDRVLDKEFRDSAGFFDVRNFTYKYERIPGNKVRVYFKDRMEHRDQPIIENGKNVGRYTLVIPHTITTREGTFICEGVNKIIDREIMKGWRSKGVNIKKKFLSRRLVVRINNENLNIKIECDSIIPETYTSKTRRISEAEMIQLQQKYNISGDGIKGSAGIQELLRELKYY